MKRTYTIAAPEKTILIEIGTVDRFIFLKIVNIVADELNKVGLTFDQKCQVRLHTEKKYGMSIDLWANGLNVRNKMQ